jgi:capsule polysaccharide export protein KpsE/RkpR
MAEEEYPRDAALRQLGERTSFEVSLDYDYLAVKVLDEDPALAAQMANYFIAQLNKRHIEMSAGSAAENREFIERRLQEAELALDSAQAELQQFQERNGLLEIEAQATALMGALGEAQGEIARAEVQYEALRSQLGDDNPDVQSALAGLTSARAARDRLTGGGEAVMPVPIRQLPAVGREYAQIYQELRTQEEILKVVRPLYEQAALSESRQASAVQVLDPAIPPERKAEPRRSLIVLSAMVASVLLATLLLLAVSAWREHRGEILGRLRVSQA